MTKNWFITRFFGLVAFILAFLFSVYPNEVRQIITPFSPISDVELVYYIFLFVILIVAIVFCVAYIGIPIYKKFRPDVIIQDDSLRFNKYPRLVGNPERMQNMTNMSYSEVTVQNCRKTEVKKCSLEIILKKDGNDVYRSKVLTGDSTNPRNPNPMTVTLDGKATVGFHPVCLSLDSFQAFLPNHSLGVAGNFTGTPIAHDEYEMYGKVIYDGKLGKLAYLGKINIPDDFVNKSVIPNAIQVTIDQGGFAVYVEYFQEKVRAKFFGHLNDDIVKDAFQQIKKTYPKIDDLIEINGQLQKCPPANNSDEPMVAY